MKINKYIGFTMLVASLVTTTSCSDWNDWNEVQSDPNPTADKTLWENISEISELKNFKTILEKVNMEDAMKSSKFHTVWAPELTDMQRDSILALDNDVIVTQFVKNHIAEYNHQATGVMENRIHTLNFKAYNFEGSNFNYTFNNIKLSKANIPNTNGTLHILENNSPFLPNAYQNLWMTDDVDSIANYFKKYELTVLDESQSVPGPIVNGKQTYIDSVMITYNTMTRSIRAALDDEDSVYTFLMPNNKAYETMYNDIKSLYKYKESTQGQNVADAAASTYETVTGTSNVSYLNYLADSLTRRQIVNNLAYSHTNIYNKLYFEEGSHELDTINSTFRNMKFSEPDRIFDPQHIVERKPLSNGDAVVVDSLGFKTWETYNPENIISGLTACRYLNGNREIKAVSNYDSTKVTLEPGVKTFNYIQVVPKASTSKPEVDYYLTDVKSEEYYIYVVIPPASVDLEDETKVLPNWLTFKMTYFADSKVDSKDTKVGSTSMFEHTFTNERFDPNNDEVITTNPSTGAEVRTKIDNTDFFNDTTKVDTILLGSFKFPYCYVGLDGVYPNIKVTCSSKFSTLNSRGHTSAFDRTIRINSIIMRPKDYEEYLNEE